MDRLGATLPVRYRLVREVGRGGTARVFLARELHPEREVAIKVLEPAIAAMVGPDRFLREVDFASKLSHPHILPIFAAGEAAGLLYYVMPYVAGDTVRDRLARERVLPLDDALRIAIDVADALSYAHERNVLHRDIKPENVLLQAGHAIVADFGIARAITVRGTGTITESGFVLGTPAYMSPEQAAGSETIDGRADMYSLGCVLYEMLTGETPHTGATPEAILAKKLHSPPARASALRPTVPPSVESVLDTALARTPADRYPTAGELRDALVTAAALRSVPTLSMARAAAPSSDVQRPSFGGAATPLAASKPRSVPTLQAFLVSRTGLTTLLVSVILANWIETTAEGWLAGQSDTVRELRHQLAHAMHWLEGRLSFAGHDVTNAVAVYGFSIAYFLLFPALVTALAVALARRPNLGPYRVLATATVVDYVLSVPFYVLFPVPERWAFAESGAALLSDQWTSGLIEFFRPLSGLDNCFPSFHVSLTVIVVLLCFLDRSPWRWTAFVIGLTVILSTVAIGIHWLADVVGGVAIGLASVAAARRIESRWQLPSPALAHS
jgi:membrane-associated phospholipid phosphatase